MTLEEKVAVKLVAAGYLPYLRVTMKSGFFTYMMPCWVHRLHLKFNCLIDEMYAMEVDHQMDMLLLDLMDMAKEARDLTKKMEDANNDK